LKTERRHLAGKRRANDVKKTNINIERFALNASKMLAFQK